MEENSLTETEAKIILDVLRREYFTAVKTGNTGDYEPFITLLSQMVYENQKDYRLI